MKIILLKNVSGLGDCFDLKKVKVGYGRNFLLSQGLAILATKNNLKWREKQIKEKDKVEQKNLQKTKKVLEELEKKTIEIPIKVGGKGELFEKVDESKIVKILKKEKIDIKKENIKLKKKITRTGNYTARVNLGEQVSESLKIKVKKEKNEVKKKKTKK